MSGYTGQIATIPLGTSGIYTDAPQSMIPSTNLIRANNVTYYNTLLEKDYGSRRWNSTALPSGVAQFHEMYTDTQSANQRIFTLLQDGTVWRFTNPTTKNLVAAVSPAPTTLNPNAYTCMTLGGNEMVNNPKKMFIFTGYNPVQVVAGDNLTRTNMSAPASDWTGGNQPFWGLIHRGRLFCGGCPNNPYQIYASLATNHEDFTTTPLNFNVYPGESDIFIGGQVFRGVLYVFKYPLGVYQLIDTDPDAQNWYFQKFTDDFGGCSPQGFAIKGDDLLVANNYGSITSMAAAFKLGNIDSSDVFHQLGIRRMAEQEVRPDIVFKRSMMYYGFKQQLFVSYQSFYNPYPDRMISMDLRAPQSPAKVALITKDQPNCLGTIRDLYKVPRPFYGANDGYLYALDQEDRWVGAASGAPQTAIAMDAQTPHMDFSQGSALLGCEVKKFEFLMLEYEPTGNFNVTISVYLDSKFMGDYPCDLSGRSNLDELPLPGTYVVDGLVGFSNRIPIYGTGKRISLRFRNSGVGQNVRLVKAYIFYRPLGEQQTVG